MLKQKFVLDFGVKTIYYLLQAIGSILVARFAGPSITGTIAYGTAFAGVLGFINGLLGPAHVKITADSSNEGDCNTTFAVLKVLFTLIFLVLAFISFSSSVSFNYNFDSYSEKDIVVLIAIGTIAFYNIVSIPDRIFVARMQQARSNIPYLVSGIAYNGIRIVLAVVGFGAIILSTTTFISYLLVIPLYLVYSRDVPFGKFRFNLSLKYLKLTIPIFIIVISNSLSFNLGRLLLEDFTSIKELGVFAAGSSISNIFMLMASTAGTVFYPLFAKNYVDHEYSKIAGYILKFERFVFLWVFPLILCLSVFSRFLVVNILGSQYNAAESVFKILVLASLLQVLAIPFANLLFSFNKFSVSTVIAVGKLIIQLFFLYILSSPDFFNLGIIGLAIAIFLSEMFIFSIRNIVARRLLKFSSYHKNIPLMMIGFFWYIVFTVLIEYTVWSNLLTLIYLFLFLSLTYLSFVLFGVLKREDLNEVFSLVNTSLMKKYISSETKRK